MRTMRAWGYGLRRDLPHSMPGRLTSAEYLAWPVTFSGPSTRPKGCPNTWYVVITLPLSAAYRYATMPRNHAQGYQMTTLDASYTVRLTVNGEPREAQVPARRTLVDLLRYDLDLTGTKETCSVGVCGACTVLLDGEITASCITLAVQADGAEVTTIEGIAVDGALHPTATELYRQRRLPMRHLHVGADRGGEVAAGRQPLAHGGAGQGVDDGQPVPLHGLLPDPGIHHEGGAVTCGTSSITRRHHWKRRFSCWTSTGRTRAPSPGARRWSTC